MDLMPQVIKTGNTENTENTGNAFFFVCNFRDLFFVQNYYAGIMPGEPFHVKVQSCKNTVFYNTFAFVVMPGGLFPYAGIMPGAFFVFLYFCSFAFFLFLYFCSCQKTGSCSFLCFLCVRIICFFVNTTFDV